MPPATPKYAYGRVALQKVSACPGGCVAPAWCCLVAQRPPLSLQHADLLDVLDVLCPSGPIQSWFPLTFEAIKQVGDECSGDTEGGAPRLVCHALALRWRSRACPQPCFPFCALCCVRQAHGFVVYRTQLPRDVLDPAALGAPPQSICDRGYVMLQKVRIQKHSYPLLSTQEASGFCRQQGCTIPEAQEQPGCRATLSPCWVVLWHKFAPFRVRGQPWAGSGEEDVTLAGCQQGLGWWDVGMGQKC